MATPPVLDREEEPRPAPVPVMDTKVDVLDIVAVNLTMALRGVGANKLRAFLTMLGVIIGVGAVIIAISIGQGSRAAVAASLQKLGTNVLTVYPGQVKQGGISLGLGSTPTLTLDDAKTILKECPSVAHDYAQVQKTGQTKYKDINYNTTISGVGPFYTSISNHPIQSGRFLNSTDIKQRRRVVVLGNTAYTNLYGTNGSNPVGTNIRIMGQLFQVVGLLQTKGGQGFRNPDDAVYIPVTTAMYRVFGMIYVQTIVTQAKSDLLMDRAQGEIETALRRAHRLTDDQQNDFIIFNQADVAATQNEQQDTFAALITYLAVVSLLVGGIGIMNIMLVSVTERTREIGVRKAIGAKRHDILLQFLLEALLLSTVGGILGVIFGVTGAEFVQIKNGWTVVLAPSTMIMAFSFSAFVGIFFGFYPAYKASNLNPIEALRYE